MRIVVHSEVPSGESRLVAEALGSDGTESSHSWDGLDAARVSADIAVCVGPVSWCPVAAKRVCVLVGPTAEHRDWGWDLVLATSAAARSMALRRFGHAKRIGVVGMPVPDLRDGCRCLAPPYCGYIHYSSLSAPLPEAVSAWGCWRPLPVGSDQFCARDFNVLVRHGATGFYAPQDDGYDIQVRRHLALGGVVYCRRSPEVLGDLCDVCRDVEALPDECPQDSQEPVACGGDEVEFGEAMRGIVEEVCGA